MQLVKHYTTPSGKQPVAKWLNGRSLSEIDRADIENKIQRLREDGFDLCINKMLLKIAGSEPVFYELKSGNYRIATYYDKECKAFILLHGFKKERQREQRHLKLASKRLTSYLSTKGGGFSG